ncbi:acyltransferase family protein [Cellulomonas alba]|uniref:Acyltransferase family protein n=1 Tax=Cellulomonas alba TaxID=3053467 RepID=A0ABT7SF93_9CELL|nr:acyltransferase family protein [Cellulomonas alba]MDM7854237.1 acyltransferase family protein [Cellulomonas alba]
MADVDGRSARAGMAGYPGTGPGAWVNGAGADPVVAPAGRAADDRTHGRIRGLDGLRAWAVLAVIAYHVNPTWVPGGFVGVDVFFVVSGFLITTLLLREADRSGRLSLPQFWARRARRLLPALAVVVAVSLIAARLVSADLLVGTRRQVLGAATFLTNWVEVAAGTDYFAQRQPQLFQPFWSLAIEEQFYLVWPVALVVLLVALRSWRARALAALGLALTSAVWMTVLYGGPDAATRVYYGTDTHAAGLLIGVAGAFAWRSGRHTARHVGRAPWLPAAALAGLTVLALVMPAESPWTFRGGLLLAAGLALVAVAGCAVGVPGYVRVLEARPVVWVGERSYGLYLWHWPVLLIVGAVIVAPTGSGTWWFGTALAVGLTFALAAASYRWVETPVRRRGFRAVARDAAASLRSGARPPRLAGGAVAAVAVGAVVALATVPGTSSAEEAIAAGERAIEQAGQQPAPTTHTTPPPTAHASHPGAGPTGGASAPAAGSTGAPTGHPAGRAVEGGDVIAFGDSVLSAAAPAVLHEIPGIAIDAKPIRKWVDAPKVVQAAADAGRLRPVVVLAFGTNGGFQFAGSQDALAQVMSIIGPDRQVVFVNVVGISYWVGSANHELVKLSAGYPNSRVLDWRSIVTPHPSWLHSDRTHPSMAGIGPYAEMLKDAFATMSVS